MVTRFAGWAASASAASIAESPPPTIMIRSRLNASGSLREYATFGSCSPGIPSLRGVPRRPTASTTRLAKYSTSRACTQNPSGVGSTASTRTPVWTVLEPSDLKTNSGAVLTKQPDGSILVSGPNTTPVNYTIKVNTTLTGITGLRLEVLNDPSLPAKGPGRAANGNFVLNEFSVSFAKDDKDKAKPVKLHSKYTE